MAGIASAAQMIAPVITGLSAVNNIAGVITDSARARKSAAQAERQMAERQAEQGRQAQENADMERQKLALSSQQADAERRSALKRAVARQRAMFGSAGISPQDGSSKAVLLGMFDESDDERQRREDLDQIRLNAIDQNIAQQGRLNILQRTQLSERNRIDKASGFSLAKSIFSSF